MKVSSPAFAKKGREREFPRSPVKVSNPTIVGKRRERVPKSPVSPQVENIKEERENNNWITRE